MERIVSSVTMRTAISSVQWRTGAWTAVCNNKIIGNHNNAHGVIFSNILYSFTRSESTSFSKVLKQLLFK